ncbi:MAG TPA: PQQ-binding-like beta-propeller repeat protein [Spirochaetia bacterium]|nr:PQQ-binding-like beta-propeller repeat protein [Spirochaetia bacterium]
MRIVLPALAPDFARFLSSACRGVALVAGLFSVAVTTLLVANYVQARTINPVENPAPAQLRERFKSGPDDPTLAEQIRRLDLAARRFYFTRQWQTRTAGWALVAAVAVLAACLKAMGALARVPPKPPTGTAGDTKLDAPRARTALAIAGAGLLAAGLVSAFLGARLLGPDPTEAPDRVLAAPASASAPAAVAAEAAAPVMAATPSEAATPAAPPTPPARIQDNWPQLRGPGGNGILPKGNPPVDWDGATSRNVLWKVQVPLPGRGSPAVWGDRVFLSGADASHREVFCWNSVTGALLWRRAVEMDTTPPGVADTTGYAASSVAVNGRAVFAIFPDGKLAAVGMDGTIQWTRGLGPIEMNYGYAASPAVAPGALFVQLDQLEGGSLLCLDPETGATRWETSREVTSCWASPVLMDSPRGTLVLANGNPILAAYDAGKGRKLWEAGGMRGENAPSPAFADGRVFASNQLLSLTAVKATDGSRLWEIYDDFPDVASPLAVPKGPLFIAASYGVVSALDAATGKPFWKKEFPTGFYASPILAGGRVYCLDRSGVMRIFAAGPTMDLVGSPALGERADATPAFLGGSIFIRGEKHLFCIRSGNGS